VKSATAMLARAPLDSITGYLPYASDQTRPQDIGHQLWTTTFIDTLRGGRQALDALLRGQLWRVQAQRFRDYSVASAMGGIALLDCRYATDPLVLDYAGSTAGGRPYAFKALAVQARNVAKQCFTPSGDAVSAPAHNAPPAHGLQQPNLG
jgi:hypothetical protein